ncbi:MAG: hypothetical protein PF487_07060 [Bacteroidales bacterium]|nr:hypothetical protein [Bacteroidales bacterium]
MKKRFTRVNPDLGVVAFHKTSLVKSLQILYREWKSLNLGKNHKISGVTDADIDELFALYW